MELLLPKVGDFEVTGNGDHANWDVAAWQPLTRVGAGTSTYETRAKAVYSSTGIYFLVDCEDRRLTCTMTEDMADLWNEDIVEIFLWPEESHPVYLEYEISPLGHELVLLVSNTGTEYAGWLPWHYRGERKIRKATSVRGGDKLPMAGISGWTSECFIPFALMQGLGNVPPSQGTSWRGNIFRMDYDERPMISQWAWCPDTKGEFHAFHGFGTLRFG